MKKHIEKAKRAQRVRAHLKRYSKRHRLSVFVSNKHIYAQVIDDERSETVIAASTILEKKTSNANIGKASVIGKLIAEKAKAKEITDVVLDRGSRLYHGIVKQLADSAREAGMNL
jgi:large subunit ribosomal protein L18